MIVPMVKIQMAFPRIHQEKLLQFLQEEEVVHVTEPNIVTPTPAPSAETDSLEKLEYQLAQLQFALHFISKMRKELDIHPPRRSWREWFVSRPIVTVEDLEKKVEHLQLPILLQQINDYNDQLSNLATQRQHLEEKLQLLSPWQQLQLTSDQLPGTSTTTVKLVHLGVHTEEILRSHLTSIPTAVWQEVYRQLNPKKLTGTIYLEIVVHKEHATLLEEALAASNATVVQLELDQPYTISQQYAAITQQLQHLREVQKSILAQTKNIINLEYDLQLSFDAVLHRKERQLVNDHLYHSPLTAILTGWMPRRLLDELKAKLNTQFPQVWLEAVAVNAQEHIPVALANAGWLRPFEAITDLYGKPEYKEIDPSPVLSIFFLAAFGLALSDGGYGLLMAVGAGLASYYFKLKYNLRKLVNLFFYAGLATVVFGALTGSWFGINLEALPPSVIRDILLAMRVIDPISQPMNLLLVAFAIGIIQLMSVWVIRAYYQLRKGNYILALLDNITWLTLLMAIGLWVASSRQIVPNTWNAPTRWFIYANMAVLVITQGRAYKNIFVRLGSGLLSLYGLVSFMSDTLSYARLLALGLATSIIGLVVNLMAGIAFSVPVIGIVLAALVLLVGHIFNLGINALGAFIHSARLQFVEFFPKLIEGGGLTFKPLGRIGKYTDSPNEFSPKFIS